MTEVSPIMQRAPKLRDGTAMGAILTVTFTTSETDRPTGILTLLWIYVPFRGYTSGGSNSATARSDIENSVVTINGLIKPHSDIAAVDPLHAKQVWYRCDCANLG